MAVTVPSFIPEPFANEGQKATIPDTPSSEQGRASWQLGFPQVCAQPLASGGIPPNYLDFQGIFNALSSSICYMQTGALWPWSSKLTYPLGAHVLGSDNNEYVAEQENTGQDPTQDDGEKWKNVTSFLGTAFLPLAGGTMTGPINRDGVLAQLPSSTSQYLAILGSTTSQKGSGLYLYSDTSPQNGLTILRARGADQVDHDLRLQSDGGASWDGKQIVRTINGLSADAAGNVVATAYGSSATDAAGQFYLRFPAHKIQLCWGYASTNASTGKVTVSFNQPFDGGPLIIVSPALNASTENVLYQVVPTSKTSSSCTFVLYNVSGIAKEGMGINFFLYGVYV